MKPCPDCGAKLSQDFEICPFCFKVIKPEKYPKKIKKYDTKKIIRIGGSYIAFLAFLLMYIFGSEVCYQSRNIICYRTSYIYLGLCVCFCFASWIFLGMETEFKTAESLMASKNKKKKSKLKNIILFLLFIILCLITFLAFSAWVLWEFMPLS